VNLLFICSRNQWRSPTAEAIVKNKEGIKARSAGTEPSRIRLNQKHLLWADIIFVMEKKHKQRIRDRFPEEYLKKEIIILDIPDEYGFMSKELIDELESRVKPYVSF
jgi:predicted protein tyrosine phosphatase